MIRKFPQILRAYLFMLLYKAGFINDVAYKRVLRQRSASCESCVLRKGNWCSRKRTTAIINDDGKPQKIKGCGCYIPGKIFDNTPNPCPMNKWVNFDNN